MHAGKIVVSVIGSFLVLSVAFAQGPYHQLRKIPIGGEGGWDYLTSDITARRLYVSHSSRVEVLDLDSGALVGAVENLSGVHGIAVAPELGRGFITNGKADAVTIFDLKTLQKLGEVKTAGNPDAIVYDPATQRVFVNNGKSDSTTVIDAKGGGVVGTIDLGGAPEFAAVDGQGRLYVNLEDKSMVLKINTRELKVEDRWPLAPGQEPSSLSLDLLHRRLFIGCRNKLLVIVDADGGKVISSFPIGDHVDSGAYDPEKNLVFTACGDGTVTVVHEDAPDAFSVVGTFPTQLGSKNMALDGKTHNLFFSAGEFESPEAPSAANPHPRRKVKAGTFAVLEFVPG